MDEIEIRYGKQNKPERKETNIAQYHLYVEFEKKKERKKKVKLMEAECAVVVARGLGTEETGRDWLKSTNFQLEDEWFWGSNA